MLQLRAYLPAERVQEIVGTLDGMDGVRHAVRAGASAGGSVELVTAEVEPRAADHVLEALDRLGVPPTEVSLERLVAAGPVAAGPAGWFGSGDALVWAEVVQTARENARVFAQYLVFMAIAGVIAAFGVMNRSSILVVGAMAVSPDLLPMSAVCVGLIARRPRLAGRGLAALAIGLSLTGAAGWAIAEAMRAVGYPPLAAGLGDGGLGTLPTINASTFIIAFAAGIAGMLTLETRALGVVGVAISITTIPAVAYAGVAFTVAETWAALEALVVLCVNVAMVLSAGTLTLALQRLVRRPRRPRRPA